MIRSYTDSCVYILKIKEHTGIIPIYVDDAPAIASSNLMRKFLRNILTSEFKVRYLGSVNTLLGIQFSRFSDGSLGMNQSGYIRKLLDKYQMTEANPAPTPIDPGVKLKKEVVMTPEEEEEMKQVPYRQLIGALSYLAHATRYDISFAVNILAQYGAKPAPIHWTAAKRVLRYLKGAIDQGLTYEESDAVLHLYSDASLGTDRDDRKSYSGVAAMLGSSLVQWHASKQKSVSFSTMEAEYRAIGLATKDALWLRSLLTEIGRYTQDLPATRIFTDSMSALAHAKSRIENYKSKYIDITCHFVRDRVETGEIDLVHVPTKYNLADLFTKAHQTSRFRMLIKLLSVSDRRNRDDNS